MEHFKVVLQPFTCDEQHGNITLTKSLNQDQVIIVTPQGQRVWGYVSTVQGHGTFLPLSGFPMELTEEVQRQINEIRGVECQPPRMIASGRNAAEQDADQEFEDQDDEELYE